MKKVFLMLALLVTSVAAFAEPCTVTITKKDRSVTVSNADGDCAEAAEFALWLWDFYDCNN